MKMGNERIDDERENLRELRDDFDDKLTDIKMNNDEIEENEDEELNDDEDDEELDDEDDESENA